MKTLLFACLMLAVTLSAAEKKILTIGNSFTWSLNNFLQPIVKAQGDKITLRFANHGGCSIQRHWKYVTQEEAKAEVKKYKDADGKPAKLRDLLKSEKWDVVTIQQASPLSWRKGSFYPELDKLVAYVKKHAPGAKIMFQQTWSYRIDHPNYKRWKIDQKGMYKGIYNNYKEASEKFGFDVIPSGLAVEIARAEQSVKFVPVPAEKIAEIKKIPAEKLKKAKDRPVIKQPGSLFAGWYWGRDRKTRQIGLKHDAIHLNNRGRYLQACLWYGIIYGKSPLEIKHDGKRFRLTREDAAFLRKCADKAIKTYR